MPKKLRVFLDTSAILAGLNSPTGAAGVVIASCLSHDLNAIISPQVIEEAERNIHEKFLDLSAGWASFLLIPPKITRQPTLRDIKKARHLLPTSDAPILASAIKTKPDAFITWNTRDFLREDVVRNVTFPILRPGEFLNTMWRK
jgi:predicted nucleic acid-binding protein